MDQPEDIVLGVGINEVYDFFLSFLFSFSVRQFRASQDTCARLELKCEAAEQSAHLAREVADSSSLSGPSGDEIELRQIKQTNEFLTAEVLCLPFINLVTEHTDHVWGDHCNFPINEIFSFIGLSHCNDGVAGNSPLALF